MPLLSKNRESFGTCDICGEENCHLTMVDEDTNVCDDCLDENYFYCENCDEYYCYDYVESYELSNGKIVCENCYEECCEDDE